VNAETTLFPIQREEEPCPVFAKPGFLPRFCHFIEHADWEKIILSREKHLDRGCIGVLIVAALYFLPVLMTALSR
jgi:hypothetical protein